jgi:hypothetical protein
MKKGIGILAYNRPDHLYISLTSIFKMRDIEDYKVHVYFDGPLSLDIKKKQFEVLGCFPIDLISFSRYHLDIREAQLFRLREMFYKYNFDLVIATEDDIILQSDTLQFVSNFVLGDAAFYSLYGDSNISTDSYYCAFNPWGFVMQSNEFFLFDEWVKSQLYLNYVKVGDSFLWQIPNPNNPYEIIFSTYMSLLNKNCKFSPKGYTAVFGTIGTHHPREPENILLMEEFNKKIFSGDKVNWLDNLIALLKVPKGTYPDAIEYMVRPIPFIYR